MQSLVINAADITDTVSRLWWPSLRIGGFVGFLNVLHFIALQYTLQRSSLIGKRGGVVAWMQHVVVVLGDAQSLDRLAGYLAGLGL